MLYRLLSESLCFPFILVLVFICVHFAHGLLVSVSIFLRNSLSTGAQDNLGEEPANDGPTSPDPTTFQFYFSHRARLDGILSRTSKEHGGWVIFGYSVARLLGCLALLGLSINTLTGSQELGKYMSKTSSREWTEDPELYMTGTYVSALLIFGIYYVTSPVLGLRFYFDYHVHVYSPMDDLYEEVQHIGLTLRTCSIPLSRFLAFGDFYPASRGSASRRESNLGKDANSWNDYCVYTHVHTPEVCSSRSEGICSHISSNCME